MARGRTQAQVPWWPEAARRRRLSVEAELGGVSTQPIIQKEVVMTTDLLSSYARASGWAVDKVGPAAHQLDAPTPCEQWDVRTLLNHMLDTQRYFIASGRGEDALPPSPTPPVLLSDEPEQDFEAARAEMLAVYADPGVQDTTGPALGVAFADQLLHGWDLARATGQVARPCRPAAPPRPTTPSTACSPPSNAKVSSNPRSASRLTRPRRRGCWPSPAAIPAWRPSGLRLVR